MFKTKRRNNYNNNNSKIATKEFRKRRDHFPRVILIRKHNKHIKSVAFRAVRELQRRKRNIAKVHLQFAQNRPATDKKLRSSAKFEKFEAEAKVGE